MNEMTMNMGSMYEEVSEIQKLNRVEGFDPRRYMRTIQDEGQPARYYLDVAFRKLWFRLKYPEGKIVKHILKLTDQVAIVEARVYLNRNDEPDNFISNALAQKYMTADTQFGNKYVELAETVERQIVANPNIKLNLSFFTLFPQIIPAFSSIPSDYS